MDKDIQRTQLTDEQVGEIAGGRIFYSSTINEIPYIYSSYDKERLHKYAYNPDNMFTIDCIVKNECRGMSDDAIIERLLQDGLVTPFNG